MTRPDHEIDAYLEDALTAEQAAVLEAWINASPNHAAAFLHMVRTHQVLDTIGREARLNRQAEEFDPLMMASLAKMEAQAERAILAEQERPADPHAVGHRSTKDDVTMRQALIDLRWAAGKVGYRLAQSKTGVTSAVAAMLLIALLLIAPWKNNTPAPSPGHIDGPIAGDTSNIQPPKGNTVATLTAERDAVWSNDSLERAIAPGSSLRAGQRLTITRGFAEITTRSGAVAILQAPCTVELIDHDNAIRLISGKLVGICETGLSKGFLVRAPHMDVTDLGTRFGVDAASPAHTDIHVFEGKVEINRPDVVDAHQEISTGHSLRASAGNSLLVPINQSYKAFGALRPITFPLQATGEAMTANEADMNWQITAVNGQRIEPAVNPVVSDSTAYYQTLPSGPKASKFISWKPPSGPGAGEFFTYTFSTSFNVSDQVDPNQLRLSVRYIADNALAAVVINGKRIGVDGDITIAFSRWRNFTLSDHLVAGKNTIEFEVRNHYAERFATAGQVGLRVAWELGSITTLFEE
ncbi:MAG: FecR domain-containing protein [Planctomycetota bacterium]